MLNEPTIFRLLDALERAQDRLERAKYIDSFARMQHEEHSARVQIEGLTERIRGADLMALPPAIETANGYTVTL